MNAKKKCKEAKKTHKKGCKEWNFIYFCKKIQRIQRLQKNPKSAESSKKAKKQRMRRTQKKKKRKKFNECRNAKTEEIPRFLGMHRTQRM